MAGFEFVDKALYGEDSEDSVEPGKVFDTGYRLNRKVYNTKDGKRYWLYFTEGQLRGNKAEVNFTTTKKDPVAYTQIAFIFEVLGEKTIPIFMEESSFKDSDGKVVQTVRYFVGYQEQDELGGEVKVLIKPKNESDKTFWNYYMARLKKQRELEAEKAAQNANGGDIPPETPPAETPGKKNKS